MVMDREPSIYDVGFSMVANPTVQIIQLGTIWITYKWRFAIQISALFKCSPFRSPLYCHSIPVFKYDPRKLRPGFLKWAEKEFNGQYLSGYYVDRSFDIWSRSTCSLPTFDPYCSTILLAWPLADVCKNIALKQKYFIQLQYADNPKISTIYVFRELLYCTKYSFDLRSIH